MAKINSNLVGIDRYYTVKTGREFSEMPFMFRTELWNMLTPEEYGLVESGHSDAGLLNKAQKVFANWYNEQSPTDEKRLQDKNEADKRGRISSLQWDLSLKEKSLEKYNKIVALDGVVPIGIRKSLQLEITHLKNDLAVMKPPKPIEQPKIRPDEGLLNKAREMGLEAFLEGEAGVERDENGNKIK